MIELDWHKDRADNPSLTLLDSTAPPGIDLRAVRAYRLRRVRDQMAAGDIAACLLFDPVNIRYATDARNMQVFHLRNPSRYLFLGVTGPVILFEFTGAEHLGEGLETIDEVRPAVTASYVAAGPDIARIERLWAEETGALIREHFGSGVRVGVERVNARAAMALSDQGFDIVDAQQPVEMARATKSPGELELIKASLRATEHGVHALRKAVRPGITENELWSVLHAEVIARGGDYIETRLLTSGSHTNPWFQEAGDKVIFPDELVALDTDVVGCYGYYADFSRTFHSGPAQPSKDQQALYRAAYEQVHHNMGIITPGMTFREYAERAWDIPGEYVANRYYLSAHGVGMTGEYPYLYHAMDFPRSGYDGVIEPMMTLCIESYIGREGGKEGVKLEEQILVTDDGVQLLSDFPFEHALLGDNVVQLRSGGHVTPIPHDPAADLVTEVTRQVLAHLASDGDPCGSGGQCAVRAPQDVRSIIDCGGERVTFRGDTTGLRDGALNRHLEYVLLEPDVTAGDVEAACAKTVACGFASIVVNPTWVSLCDQLLADSEVKVVAAVAYPFGTSVGQIQAQEARQALRNGAGEIEVVLNTGVLRSGMVEEAAADLERVGVACREAGATMKVVIEAGLLSDEEKRLAVRLAGKARADYLKTATGFGATTSTNRDVRIILEALSEGSSVEPPDSRLTRIGAGITVSMAKRRAHT